MAIINIIRWVFAGLLAAVWLLFAIGNASSMIEAARRKGSTSLTLFVGGIAGALSLLICPLPGTARWAWAPAVLDMGCIPAAFAIGYALITQRQSSEPDEQA